MEADVGRLLRLRTTIRSAIEDSKYSDGKGELLVKLFARTFAELRSVVGGDRSAELERLMPDHRFGGNETWRDKIDFENARLMLSTLAGWIDGLVEEAQFATRVAAEAEAYAEARVKAERGIGFKA
jgi:hypothetical protein